MKFKKVISALAACCLASALLCPSVMAQNKSFSFYVKPSENGGNAWSAPNPKDDNEQACYIYTTNHNIISTDKFNYCVRRAPSTDNVSLTGYINVTPDNASRIVRSYSDNSGVGKGTSLYLQGNTNRYNVFAEGYWFS